jgi:serine/threonine protein phosphatase PrpC
MMEDVLGSWRSVAERAVGVSHTAVSAPCQDHLVVDCCTGADGRVIALVAAVADGAGSASASELGSSQAVSFAVSFIKRYMAVPMPSRDIEPLVREAMLHARSELVSTAAQQQLCLRDLATTLLVAVVVEDGGAFGQIGDGAIVFGDATGLSSAFDIEQEVLNVTDFLTDDDAPALMRTRSVETRIDRLALLSDGLAPLLIDQRLRAPHQPAFDSLFKHVMHTTDVAALAEDLRAFLDSPAVNERTDDDKALVLAVRVTQP